MIDGSNRARAPKKSVVLVGTVLIALGGTTGVTLSQNRRHRAATGSRDTPPPASPPGADPMRPHQPRRRRADLGRLRTFDTGAQPRTGGSHALDACRAATNRLDSDADRSDSCQANASDVAAMEELARRLIQGIGVPKDQQAGAGWMLRAAQRGSINPAFNRRRRDVRARLRRRARFGARSRISIAKPPTAAWQWPSTTWP